MKRVALLALALVSSVAARAETIAITGGTVHTVASPQPIEGGTVLIRDGRIVAVGRNVAVPADARVIDAAGRAVTPGLFNGFTRVGLVDVEAVRESNDTAAKGAPIAAAFDVSTAVNPLATAIPVSRIEGVTRVAVAPKASRGVFAGQGALIQLGDGFAPVFKARGFQFVELGEEGGELAGGSRAAALAAFKTALAEAREYQAGPTRYRQIGEKGVFANYADARALVPVVTGEMPVMVHASRAADLLQVIALKREFPALRLIIVGAEEGWMVADQLAAAGVPVIVNTLENLPSRFETLAATMNNPGRMAARGVLVALGTVSRDEAMQARVVLQYAGNLVGQSRLPGGEGMSWAEALKTVTLNPARIFGVDKALGTLEPGKLADVVVWEGDPLDLMAAPAHVLIQGREVPLTSRQTRLRDRYRTLDEQALPVQYRH